MEGMFRPAERTGALERPARNKLANPMRARRESAAPTRNALMAASGF
jgi:hypothetical protein